MSHIKDINILPNATVRNTDEILEEILIQLKINNTYLEAIIGEKLTELDVED